MFESSNRKHLPFGPASKHCSGRQSAIISDSFQPPRVRSGKPSTLLIRFHFSYISPSRFPFTVLLELSKEMPLNYLFLMTLFIKLFSIAPDSHSMGAFMDLFKDVQADMDGGHLPRHSFLCCVFLEGMVTKDSAGTGCETSLQPV